MGKKNPAPEEESRSPANTSEASAVGAPERGFPIVGIRSIFVDHHLCIQRFTPTVTQVINLIQTDVGRPVSHIVSNLVGYDRLVADAQAVLDTLAPREVEVQTRGGAWYLLRIRHRVHRRRRRRMSDRPRQHRRPALPVHPRNPHQRDEAFRRRRTAASSSSPSRASSWRPFRTTGSASIPRPRS